MKTLFRREVYIRLAEDGTAFVSTVKYGGFFSRTIAIPLNRQPLPDSAEDKALVPQRKRSSEQ
jgi:hypothetical protein